MLPIKTVLHATDFSPCSDAARHVAAALARDYQARLVILHVAHPPLHFQGRAPVPPQPEEWGREELEQKLRRLTAPGLAPEYRLEFADDTAAGILAAADGLRCDLIVLGTHGRSALGRLLLGSVAQQVVRTATCPVLTIRAGVAAEPPP